MSIVKWLGGCAASLKVRMGLAMVAAAALAACGLPAAAPTSIELTSSKNDADFPYSVVKMDRRVVSILDQFHPGFGPGFRSGPYRPTNALQRGDIVTITVYETGGQNLFPPPAVVPGAPSTSSNTVGAVSTGASNIPPQVVEADGTIFMPFVGRVKVAGLTPGQAGVLLEKDLEGKAVGPQVMVVPYSSVGNAVTVGGEVNSAKSVSIGARGDRVLDVIAAAGGARYPAYETYVQIVRNKQVGKVLLQTVINNPAENIFVRPHDQVYLSHNPRTYAVMGATQKVALYPFAYEKVTLAEAIAQAGGPIDVVGDPSGIYLFRFEPWFIAKDILPPDALPPLVANPPEFVPILYKIDMRAADGYFLTQALQMRDKDVVLITNAASVQINKLMAVVRSFTGVAYDLKRSYGN
ncbi:MAG TPA: polysaccharide biosynthesis/export family protein [Pseudolabrys sp.]|nr:polysaccharide biosynthesis/export family protein [Pseudolabrys sp.]